MEFSIKMVTDGQKATISITGLGNDAIHKEEIKEHLYKAIGLALGIEEPQNSCFEPIPNALPDGQLEPATPDIIVPRERENLNEYQEREGVTENIEDIKMMEDLQTPIKNENLSNNREETKLENQNKYHFVKSMKERDIILSLFVCSSEQQDNELLNELKQQLVTIHS